MSEKTISSMKSREGAGDTFAQLLLPDCGLKMCRPLPSKGESIIRIIPEVSADGNMRPMFGGKGAAGNIWSSLAIENISVNVGGEQKFTVINTPSDKPGMSQLNAPFSAAFIKLRGKQKNKSYAPELAARIEALFQGVTKPGQNFATGQAMTQAKDMVLAQAVVLKLNGQLLPKPASKQVVLLSATTAESLEIVLTKALADGIDMFSPKAGRTIVFKPLKQRGTDVTIYDAEIGAAVPLAEEACRKLWVPWEKALVKFTYDELMLKLISAIGVDVAASIFPEDVNRLTRSLGTTKGPATQSQAQAAPQTTYAPNPAAAASTAGAAQTLELDLDGEAVDLEAGGAGSAPTQSGTPIQPQSSTDLEKMYADMLKDDPTLGIGGN